MTALPKPLLAPPRDLVQKNDGNWFLTQLGQTFALRTPVDWKLSQQPEHSHLQRLAMHYHEFLNCLPFPTARDILIDWIGQNPKHEPGYWLDSWNSYAISIRCVCWMQWLDTNKAQLLPQDHLTIQDSLTEQIQFLIRNLETDICGNHLIKNIRCLLWASAFFESSTSAMLGGLAQSLLWQQIPVQVLPDGMHFELSPAYHCQVFLDLLDCARLLEGYPKEKLLTVLEKMASTISDLMHPDGMISLFSDGGLHMVHSAAECLKAWEGVTGKETKLRQTIQLENSGYYGIRFGETYFLADAGPICADSLPAHGHADQLSFEWSISGKRVVVDAGVGEYEPGQRRNWGRSTRAHNTVTVNDFDQAELLGSFRTGRRATIMVEEYTCDAHSFRLVAASNFNTPSCSWKHRRKFEVCSDSIRINDQVDGMGGIAISRILLHDQCRVEHIDSKSVLISGSGLKIAMSANCEIRVKNAEWSPDFGVWLKTKQLEIQMGSLPCKAEVEMRVIEPKVGKD